MVYILIFIYVALNAIAPVVLKLIASDIPHNLLIFMATLYAIIALHLLNYRSNKVTYCKIFYNKRIRNYYWQIAIISIIMWVGGFLVPIYFTPFVFVFPYLAWPGFWGSFYLTKSANSLLYKVKFILISGSLILFYGYLYTQYTFLKFLVGVFGTFLIGSLLFVYFRISFRLNSMNFSPKEIMATRFWLLLLLPLALIILNHEFSQLTWAIVAKSFVISMITLVIPLYCGQISVKHLGSEIFGIIIGITPFLTVFLQNMVFGLAVTVNLVLSLILFLAIVLPYIAGKLKHKV